MAQAEYNFTSFGTGNTSTGVVVIKSGTALLHTVNVLTTGTGSTIFYNATTSSTSNEIAVISPSTLMSYKFDLLLNNGLTRGSTTSTAEVTVAWA